MKVYKFKAIFVLLPRFLVCQGRVDDDDDDDDGHNNNNNNDDDDGQIDSFSRDKSGNFCLLLVHLMTTKWQLGLECVCSCFYSYRYNSLQPFLFSVHSTLGLQK
jgi:hypothetical protein